MDLSNFQLTYDDEFNSFTSSPDGSQGYQTSFYFGGRSLPSNGEQEFYSDSSVGTNPFSLDNGALTITAAPGSNPDGAPYNSGLITTEGDFSQTYGYFEMRAELPQGQGMWPAFWLLPTDKGWPPELDALEAFGAQNANGEGGSNTYHVGAITSDWSSGGGGDWVPSTGDITSGYHTYGVDWEPDHVTYYMDGQQVAQYNTPSDMHKPMYMLANLAVGGNWPGSPAGETGQMKIDYIRAYSSDPNAHAVAMQQVSSPDGTDTAGNATDGMSHAAIAADPATGTAGNATDGTSQAATAGDPGTGSNSVELHVSEDGWDGDSQFVVTVDGHQVGGVQTATASHTAGQWQDVVVHGDFDNGPHTVAVEFINDGSGSEPGQDRNLYVQSIDVDGQHIDGNTAENSAAHGLGDLDPNAAVMVANGEAVFHATGSTDGTATGASGTGATSTGSTGATDGSADHSANLLLHVSEDASNGDAQFTVSVDGHQVGGVQTVTASHADGQWQDIALDGNFDNGPHTVAVDFINSDSGSASGQERNLYVQSVDINGQHIAGNTAENSAVHGSENMDPSAAVMVANGEAVFHTTGSSDGATGAASGTDSADTGSTANGSAEANATGTNAAATSTLTLHVSEDAWNGDAQFVVTVDGHQVGGVQTATASHSAGQVQDVTLTGDFGSTGPGSVDVHFLNDAWGGTADTDRNLYVQGLDVNGTHIAGNTASNDADHGGAWTDPSAAVMQIDGTATFDVHHGASADLLLG